MVGRFSLFRGTPTQADGEFGLQLTLKLLLPLIQTRFELLNDPPAFPKKGKSRDRKAKGSQNAPR